MDADRAGGCKMH